MRRNEKAMLTGQIGALQTSIAHQDNLSRRQDGIIESLTTENHDLKRKLLEAQREVSSIRQTARDVTNRLKRLLLTARLRVARLEGRMDIVGPDGLASPDVDVPAPMMSDAEAMRQAPGNLYVVPNDDSWLSL